MSTRRGLQLGLSAVALMLGLVLGGRAEARPTYFEVFTARYGITPSDRTYACGNCHIRWTGTGARNPFGTAVEQQLYIGKSITQALEDIEPMAYRFLLSFAAENELKTRDGRVAERTELAKVLRAGDTD